MKKTPQEIAKNLLEQAGITINGSHPWDIVIHNEQVYERVLRDGSLGLGESYMDGWWDCTHLDQFFYCLFQAHLDQKIQKNKRLLFRILLAKLFNMQTKIRSLEVGKKHYDIGNELFERMLDSRMNYTCGYWHSANNLEDAQLAKLDLICRKLQLLPGMRVLDIGCGFGGFAKYAAEKYGVSVVGITISQQQYQYASQYCAGLPIEIRFQDYRDVEEKFDRIVSIGMFEAVGHTNYRTYMKVAHRCLTEEGLFLLHTIGNNTPVPIDEWFNQYIFPNGIMPTIQLIAKATENLFIMEDWHNFGADYDKTLMAWQHNFAAHWPEIKNHYNERFYRMWNYYLLLCAGAFRARDLQLWQIVFSKKGVPGGYRAPR